MSQPAVCGLHLQMRPVILMSLSSKVLLVGGFERKCQPHLGGDISLDSGVHDPFSNSKALLPSVHLLLLRLSHECSLYLLSALW
jgi:hypothetical protein